jgi:hypothetical protein
VCLCFIREHERYIRLMRHQMQRVQGSIAVVEARQNRLKLRDTAVHARTNIFNFTATLEL